MGVVFLGAVAWFHSLKAVMSLASGPAVNALAITVAHISGYSIEVSDVHVQYVELEVSDVGPDRTGQRFLQLMSVWDCECDDVG